MWDEIARADFSTKLSSEMIILELFIYLENADARAEFSAETTLCFYRSLQSDNYI